jgi:hypothetical protein
VKKFRDHVFHCFVLLFAVAFSFDWPVSRFPLASHPNCAEA